MLLQIVVLEASALVLLAEIDWDRLGRSIYDLTHGEL
jgi:hypothetical protein